MCVKSLLFYARLQFKLGTDQIAWCECCCLSPRTTTITLRSHSQCTLCSCWRLLSISIFEYVLKTERKKVSMTHFACNMPMFWETGFIPSSHIMEMGCYLIAKKILNSSSNGPICCCCFCWYSWRSFHLHLKCRLPFVLFLFSNGKSTE